MMRDDVTPPPGATWVGEWDHQFDVRIFGGDPITVGGAATLLTGVQARDGSTVSGAALRVDGVTIGTGERDAVTIDLTPEQAREIGTVLLALAERAEALDRGSPRAQ